MSERVFSEIRNPTSFSHPDRARLFRGLGPLLRELFQSVFQPVTNGLNSVGFLVPL